MLSAGGLRAKYCNAKSPASRLSGPLKAWDQPAMLSTGCGFAHYHALSAVWSLPERRRIRGGVVAWDKRLQTIPACLYAETATPKTRTPTIDWDEPNSSAGIDWIWPASSYGSIATGCESASRQAVLGAWTDLNPPEWRMPTRLRNRWEFVLAAVPLPISREHRLAGDSDRYVIASSAGYRSGAVTTPTCDRTRQWRLRSP
jgi:hypothetical protein